MNLFFCNLLMSHGYDASHLRKEAPKRLTYVVVTQPQSLARVRAVKDAKTAGQLFFATGGRHINTDEFFKAKELKRRADDISAMEEQKKQRGLYCKDQRGAVLLLRSKGKLTVDTEKSFTLPKIKTLLKWKKVKTTSNKKKDMVDAYVAAAKPKIQNVWCNSEEKALVALKSEDIMMKDTAVGVAASQMARAVTTNLAQLDEQSRAELKAALASFEDDVNPNII
jgi:hypothetical protein